MSEVVRYKTPILALQSDNVQASGGIVEVVKASDYDKLQERADESDSARKYAQSVGSDLVKKLRALRAEKAGDRRERLRASRAVIGAGASHGRPVERQRRRPIGKGR